MIADSAAATLDRIIREDTQFRTTAKGLARSLVWRDGVPPPGLGENFGPNLTHNLLLQADRSLLSALQLILSGDDNRAALGRSGFHRAAEAYESLLRNGDARDKRRSLNRVLAAASYHLAGYAASAYSLLRTAQETEIPDLMLRVISLVLERDLTSLDEILRGAVIDFYWNESVQKIPENHVLHGGLALAQNFAHAMCLFVYAMRLNKSTGMDECLRRLEIGECFALSIGDVWSRLLYSISRPLVIGLWSNSIMNAIPTAPADSEAVPAWSDKRTLFGRVLGARKIAELELWPSQIEAVTRVFRGRESFAAALPTSAGKTRIAELAVFKTLLAGKRVVYITPLRALSAQVERGVRRLFGPLGYSISALYGAQGVTSVDQETFEDNDIIVATPEKAGFALRNAPELFDNVGLVVFDEAHLVGSESRGVAYEALVVALKRRADHAHRRMIALSALLPELEPSTAAFASWISDGALQAPVSSPLVQGQSWRPTRQCFGAIRRFGADLPQRFRYEINVGGENSWLNDFVVQQTRPPVRRNARPRVFPSDRNELALAAAAKLVASQKSVLIYCPVVASVEKVCRQYLSALQVGFIAPFPISDNGEEQINRAVRIAEETLPRGSNIIRALQSGLAVHHGQLPRAYLREVDRIISLSVVRAVVASPTVNAGLNIAATCVLFNGCGRGEMERFVRYNGDFGRRLKVLDGAESMNVAGRAGRAFVDTHGEVLGVSFEPKQERLWERLLQGMARRSFTSGLAVVLDRLMTLLQGDDTPVAIVRDLIANRADSLWYEHPVAEPSLSAWMKATQMLDQALLSFVDDLEVGDEQLAAQLDASLQGSFFRAAIQDQQERDTYLLLVHSRGRTLWHHSTAEQRRGWYFAGVGLDDGWLLDEKAAIVAPLIATVERMLDADETEGVVAHLLTIAQHLFGIPCFTPKDDLPDGWRRIMRQWLEGVSLQLIFAGPDDAPTNDDAFGAAGHFIEDGIVYRLTWGMEAVRVRRPELIDDDPFAPRRGLRSAAFLESGTLIGAVALLLQIGLPSRRIAHEVVEAEGLSGLSLTRLRIWLRTKRDEPAERWAYLHEAIRPLWISFLAGSSSAEHEEWSVQEVNFPLRSRYLGKKETHGPGIICRLEIDNRVFGEFQTPDGTPVGETDWPFSSTGPKFAEALLAPDGNLTVTYVGP